MALVHFTWGELYTLFPSAQTDIFGALSVPYPGRPSSTIHPANVAIPST